MILSGGLIHRAVEDGKIRIDPFKAEQLNPASYDLRLGHYYLTYDGRDLDVKKDNPGTLRALDPAHGLWLEPGELYLMHTVERIWSAEFVTVIDGKSSMGRLGIFAHVTAGYGDPGFDGQYTLEVVVVKPTRIYPGMRFAQARFHALAYEGPNPPDYSTHGHYTKVAAQGPVPSMSWRQFEEAKK